MAMGPMGLDLFLKAALAASADMMRCATASSRLQKPLASDRGKNGALIRPATDQGTCSCLAGLLDALWLSMLLFPTFRKLHCQTRRGRKIVHLSWRRFERRVEKPANTVRGVWPLELTFSLWWFAPSEVLAARG